MTEIRHKAFAAAFKAAGAGGTTRLVAATMEVADADGDVTLTGFFGRQTVAIVPAHDWSHVPLGKGLLHEQYGEALVDVEWNLAIPEARSWFEAVHFDLENPPALQQWSYAFAVRPGGAQPGEFQGQRVQFLGPLPDGSPGAVVFEVSPVMVGAGVGVRTLSVGDVAADDVAAREYARFAQSELDRQLSGELAGIRNGIGA